MPENIEMITAWAAMLALVAAIVAVVIVVTKYKKKLKSPIYPVKKYTSLALSDARDDFIGKTVTTVKISSNKKR